MAYSRLTGRQFDTINSLSSQSAKSCELPTVADNVIICASGRRWRILARLISIVGPLWLSFTRWNSSATTIETRRKTSGFERIRESNFSLVQTKISQSSIWRASLGASPIPKPTFNPKCSPNCFNSFCFSLARAFSGTMYMPLEPTSRTFIWWTIPMKATRLLPLAVGMQTMVFLPARTGIMASA